MALSTARLPCASAELALITPLVTTAPSHLPATAIASVVALGALGTGIGYVLNCCVIRLAGATTAATVTYVMPIFSTLAEALASIARFAVGSPPYALAIGLGFVDVRIGIVLYAAVAAYYAAFVRFPQIEREGYPIPDGGPGDGGPAAVSRDRPG